MEPRSAVGARSARDWEVPAEYSDSGSGEAEGHP